MSVPIEDPILQFTLLVTAALLMQLTVERAHLPGLLGLLVVGMILGPGGAAVLPEEPIVSMLGQVGLVYVMFIAGLEIDLDVARRHATQVAAFGLMAFIFSAVPALAAGLLLGFELPAAVLLGALISSHTLLAYPILMRLDLLHRLPVVTAVGGTLLTDTLALIVLAIVLGLHAAGDNVAGALVPLGLLALLVVGALVAVPRVSRWLFRQERVSPAEQALFALAVVLMLSVTAELIGTDEILGAFLAGVCLNGVLARREQLREHIEFVGRMLFIPFFFIWTGMLLEIEVLLGDARTWLIAGLLLLLVVVGKVAASLVTGALYGYAMRDRMLMASLTLPQAAATLAITVTAREANLFEAQMVDAVIILIFVTCLAGPLLVDRIGARIVAGTEAEAREPPMHRPADEEEQ